MKYRSILIMIRSWLFLGTFLVLPTMISSQEPSKDDLSQKPQWQRRLAGDHAKRAAELQTKIDEAQEKNDYKSAINLASELYELRKQLQGSGHHEAINEKWQTQVLTTVAALPAADPDVATSRQALRQRAARRYWSGDRPERLARRLPRFGGRAVRLPQFWRK